MRFFQHTAVILSWIAGTVAIPVSNADFNNQTLDSFPSELHELPKRSLSNGITLRILPLGASIVWGYGSTDGNGFRYPLRNKLVWEGNPVNMVGSVQTGTMADNNCECWGGYTIDMIAAKADVSIPSMPNLVLIHIGSNDMSGSDFANAHIRLGNLIDKLFNAIPGVTIIASTLLPLQAHQVQADYFNSQVPGVIRARQQAGKKIALADMSSSFFSYADQIDGQHPNDFGFKKMAAVFYESIKEVSDAGWLTAPINTGNSDVVVATNVCDKDVNHGSIGPYQIQYQLGWPDGDYVHGAAEAGSYTGIGNPSTDGIHWADIDGDGIDDYVYVSANLGQGLGVALSHGNGAFGPYLRFTYFPADCPRPNVKFAEINGDGRTDVCCVDNNGDFRCWLNKASGGDTRLPNWELTGYLKKDSGFTLAQVRLADIDGDGRSDYIGIDADTGTIWGWRNMAPGYIPPTRWLAFGGVASGLPTGLSLSGWRFADLNGDHMDDLLHVDDHGRVTTWINQRGLTAGSLTPNWISFGTHGGDATKPINITFGKFMGTGRADYSINTALSTGDVNALFYKNLDSGSTSVRGDGTRYCDMTGDGKDDIIWISIMGEINVWGNVHQFGETPPLVSYGAVLNVGRTRREIVLADFDGDKKCDVLLVDKLTGATTMLRNDFANGVFKFTNIGVVTGSATCKTQYGFVFHDNGVRWHDIDGDGRADFLCFRKDGVIFGYLNKGIGNMVNQGMIKHAELRERQNLRMGDINGDGRADLIWVDIVSSAAQVWYNDGPSGDAPGDEVAGTSAFRWRYEGQIAAGSEGRGSCIEFANINGLGRADYILVYPVTNRAFSMFNVCPNGGLTPVAPDLPVPPPITYPIGSGSSGCAGNGGGTCCTGGTGQGNYAEICSFTCTYGLCPSPCTCTSSGAGNNPPPANSKITGAAIVGLDPATFNPLCEFACSRGVCPEETCGETLELTTPSDLPSITDLDPLNPSEFGDYVEGDSFFFEYPDDTQLSLSLYLMGTAKTWPDIDCGVQAAPGPSGDTLGCEAMAVAYLFYGLARGDVEAQDLDITTRNVAPQGLHFESHPQWTPDTNSTIHRKILATTPENIWHLMGNGTYNGIPHEIHFMHHENFTGHRVIQNLPPGSQSAAGALDTRGWFELDSGVRRGYAVSHYTPRKSDTISVENIIDEKPPDHVASFIGESVEKSSANSGFTDFCLEFIENGSVAPPSYLTGTWDPARAAYIPAEEITGDLERCNELLSPQAKAYAIYPRDGFDIHSISALLASFPFANVVEHDSSSGWGMLYWRADLTPTQLVKVKGNKQVLDAPRICAEGCPDPSDLGDIDTDVFNFNITASLRREKRQTGLIVTSAATDDLAFISNTIVAGDPGGGRFLYDSSAGQNVYVFILESRGFDTHLPEFQALDAFGQSISSKAGSPNLFGLPGYTPVVSQISHASGMLAQIAGAQQGVAKNIWPVLYNWQHEDDKHWVIDALDDICTKFITTNPLSDDIAPLAVLNLSFGYATTSLGFISKLSAALNRLVAAGILPITSAGNEGVEVYKYPGVLGDPNHPYHVPGLVVVGGLNNDGTQWSGSNFASWLTLWAPAPTYTPYMNRATIQEEFSWGMGTSGACAKTSGLAAYFIGFDSLKGTFRDVHAVSDYIRGLAFGRGSSHLPGIWNNA